MSVIFLDLDGVLADFMNGVCDKFGIPRDSWKKDTWEFEDGLGLSTSEVWAKVDNFEFWSSLNKTYFADELVKLVEAAAKEIDYSVIVLSKPSTSPECLSGKVSWLRKHFSQYAKPDKYVFTARKDLLACGVDSETLRLLIDDSPKNVDSFDYSGGCGILVPGLQNELHDVNTIEYVTTKLQCFVNYVKASRVAKQARQQADYALQNVFIG